MPIIKPSEQFNFSWWSKHPHLSTLIPSFFRKVELPNYMRQRIVTPDHDFLDIDFLDGSHEKVVVLTHGLEGNSGKHYIKGAAKVFHEMGYTVVAWNCRSCSGEMNNSRKFYHHGDTEDLSLVLRWVSEKWPSASIGLTGYSMGGVINTKTIIMEENIPSIQWSAAISTPCNLEDCALSLDERRNWIYRKKFYKDLKVKLEAKRKIFPDLFHEGVWKQIKTWRDFDTLVSAPMNGFKNVQELYSQASLNNFWKGFKVPTLVLNALNDPLLPNHSNPIAVAENHSFLNLELVDFGGHCGFIESHDTQTYAEIRIREWALKYLG